MRQHWLEFLFPLYRTKGTSSVGLCVTTTSMGLTKEGERKEKHSDKEGHNNDKDPRQWMCAKLI